MALEGKRLGRYAILNLLGSGGMGQVYLAEDPRIEQQVAIKTIRAEVDAYPHHSTDRPASSAFIHEAKAIARLDHPHILPLYDYGEEQIEGTSITYIVMPYRKEGTLANWLRERNKGRLLSVEAVSYYVQQAADALQHAHDNQIIHQDVKPSNFLLRSRKDKPDLPDLLLADFGLARFSAASTSMSGTIRGTPAFMAPEQWKGAPVFASDQYALAAMAYSLLVGYPPFQGGMEQMMYSHLHTRPLPPSTLHPRIPRALDAVILQALEKKPADRYASISDFAQAFQQALSSSTPYSPTILTNTEPTIMKDSSKELHATLAISEKEVVTGTHRILTLPGGNKVSIAIPIGVYDGQIIHLNNLSELVPSAEPGLSLLLTISISSQQNISSSFSSHNNEEQTFLLPGPTPKHNTPVAAELAQPSSAMPASPTSPSPISPHASPTPTSPSHALPLSLPDMARFASPTPATPPPDIARPAPPTPPPQRRFSKTLAALLLGLVLLLVVGSIGFLYFQQNEQAAASILHRHATATAAANSASVTANAATSIVTSRTAIAATATASWFPYPPNSGTLTLNDPLSDNSLGYNWSNGYTGDAGANCAFLNGAYHVTELHPGHFFYCVAQHTNFKNFTFQVQMTIIKGFYGGILFRSSGQRHYFFRIGRDGTYSLTLYIDDTGATATRLARGSSPAIQTRLNQPNLLAVVVRGSAIDLYVNQQLIKSVFDSSYNQGQIGVVAENEAIPTEVAFSDARVWTL